MRIIAINKSWMSCVVNWFEVFNHTSVNEGLLAILSTTLKNGMVKSGMEYTCFVIELYLLFCLYFPFKHYHWILNELFDYSIMCNL